MAGSRWFILVGMLGCLLVGIACDTSLDGETAALPAPEGVDPTNPATERTTSTLDFSGVRTIRVELPNGRVTISQSDGGTTATMKVTEIIVREGLSYEVYEGLHEQASVTAERSFVDDTRLDIEATLPEGFTDADVAFDVRLAVPSGASVEVALANGPVTVTELVGNVEIQTANGAVTVDHVTGSVVAATTNREIEIIDVTGNVQIETQNADITMRLSPTANGRLSATTTEGDIRLTVAQTTAAAIELTATGGTVSANLAGFKITNVTTGDGYLSAVLNEGTGVIEASTTEGEIEFAGMQ